MGRRKWPALMNTLSEALWMAGVLAAAALAPTNVSLRFLQFCLAACRKLARNGLWVVVGMFVFGLLASALLCSRGYLPQPVIHDDFSNLLASDTFARGRLTNSPHALWQHFEGMHIIQQPTYMSKYPPGNGLMLALGQALFGEPIVGVWLSMGLAAAAIAWMLRGWLPPYWALLGAVIAVCRFAPSWGVMYTGGALAACGGALMMGAVHRLARSARPRYAMLAAAGAAILANTRPYEGLVVAVVCAVFILASRPNLMPAFARIAAPALIVLLPAAVWMGYYNQRVTGDPLLMPYQQHDAVYAANPLFLWQPDLEQVPEYRHKTMQNYYEAWERPRYLRKREFFGFNSSLVTKIYVFSRFYFGPALLIPVLLMLWGQVAGMALPGVAVAAVLLALTQTLYLHPHYAAPIAGAMILIAVQGMRRLRLWRPWGHPVGTVLTAGIVAVSLLYLLAPLSLMIAGPGRAARPRTKIVEQLRREGGKHLVLVRYPPGHSSHEEWVYNREDIDQAAIVWARELDPASNRRLASYFSDRRFWRLVLPEAKVVTMDRSRLLSAPVD